MIFCKKEAVENSVKILNVFVEYKDPKHEQILEIEELLSLTQWVVFAMKPTRGLCSTLCTLSVMTLDNEEPGSTSMFES